MKLALECPTYLLKDIQPLADFDWILTHLVLQDEDYAKYYRNSRNFKVLDNSVNELENPCSLGDMLEAEKIVNPNLVVPPDYLGDAAKTQESIKRALIAWDKDRILPCIQGSVYGEVIKAIEVVAEMGFSKVAVPYDITCSRLNSVTAMAEARQKVVETLTMVNLEIHLLGMTTIEELESYRDTPLVKSIDTGIPVLYGMKGWNFGLRNYVMDKKKPTLERMPTPEEFFSRSNYNSPAYKFNDIFYNIAYLRRVIS